MKNPLLIISNNNNELVRVFQSILFNSVDSSIRVTFILSRYISAYPDFCCFSHSDLSQAFNFRIESNYK